MFVKRARKSRLSEAATVYAVGSLAGEKLQASDLYELPAAIANGTPAETAAAIPV